MFQTKFGWVGEMWMFFFYKSLSIDLLAIWQWYEIIQTIKLSVSHPIWWDPVLKPEFMKGNYILQWVHLDFFWLFSVCLLNLLVLPGELVLHSVTQCACASQWCFPVLHMFYMVSLCSIVLQCLIQCVLVLLGDVTQCFPAMLNSVVLHGEGKVRASRDWE